jgi:hypothetical protein
VTSRCEVVFSKVYLSLDDGEFIAEVSESVVLVTEALQLGSGILVVEVGDGTAECVEGGSWADEEGVEPYGKGLGDVRG